MRKHLLALSLCLALFTCAVVPAHAAEEPSAPPIYVDGVLYEHPYTTVINQVTYVSIHAMALALRPEAELSWDQGLALVRAEGLDMSARPGNLYLYANGRYLYVPGGVRTGVSPEGILTCALVPVRTLAQAMGASVSWENDAVQVASGGEPLVPGDEFYDPDALFLLSHIIYNESGNQPMEGKIAVGNVLLNRVRHPSFPNTLYDVVYQAGQFFPEQTGAMEKTPNSGSIIAAKLCLEGASVVPNAYWFNGVGKSCWASRNKACLTVIGGHAFYG
mgnify:CR=1 FL=1